jgi:hypothetical protein
MGAVTWGHAATSRFPSPGRRRRSPNSRSLVAAAVPKLAPFAPNPVHRSRDLALNRSINRLVIFNPSEQALCSLVCSRYPSCYPGTIWVGTNHVKTAISY